MTQRSLAVTDLPGWPRYLSREMAAAYVGVSPNTFDDEVADGAWPAARRRGRRGGALTWDRLLLDAAADRDSGLIRTDAPGPVEPPGPNAEDVALERARNYGASPKLGPQHRHQKAA